MHLTKGAAAGLNPHSEATSFSLPFALQYFCSNAAVNEASTGPASGPVCSKSFLTSLSVCFKAIFTICSKVRRSNELHVEILGNVYNVGVCALAFVIT
jgi:hypothetical protein